MLVFRSIVATLFSAVALNAQAPRVDSVAPSQVPIAGGTQISILGANFTGAAVTVDNTVISSLSVSSGEIQFTAPKHDNGIVTIGIATASGTAYCELLYVPPNLTDLPPGYITTVAGMGFFTGLYRTATQAEVQPIGNPAFDQNGGLYIPEWLNNRIIRLRPDGILVPFAGSGQPETPGSPNGDGGPALQASIDFPRGVSTDSNGYVYITENNEGRLRRVDTRTGIITTIAGTGTPGFSGDGGPALSAQLWSTTQITGDGKGTIYFIDYSEQAATGRIRKITPDGIITTVAGNGTSGFSGDGGPAKQAQFNFQYDDGGSLALDPQGNLFVADPGNHRIRRIDGAAGVITTFATLAAGDPAPRAVAADSQGNVYFESGFRIQKLSPSGQILASYGSGTGGSRYTGTSPDGTPIANVQVPDIWGLAIDPAGNIVYIEANGGRVRRLNLVTGTLETLAGMAPRIIGDNGPAVASTFFSGDGDIKALPNGELLAGDTGHDVVRKIDASGKISTFAQGNALFTGDVLKAFNLVAALLPDSAGGAYLADAASIYQIDSSGNIQDLTVPKTNPPCGYSGDGGSLADADVCQPWDFARDSAGNLYIADTNNNRIRRVDAATGVVTTFAGSGPVNGFERYGFNGNGTFCGDGGPALQACLNTPYAVAVDPDGNVLIADSYNGRIRKVDGKGVITTFADLNILPTKMALDSAGNVYVALPSQVVRVDPFGSITAIAGAPTKRGFSGDGGPAAQALMSAANTQSVGITIDSDGNILFIDANNNRIRAIRFGAVMAPSGAQAAIRGGTPQSTPIGMPFSSALVVYVGNSAGNPAGNVRVDFGAPVSGAACTFANGQRNISVFTDRNGTASALCTANTSTGGFTVTATPLGTTISLNFALTNTAPALVSNSVVNGASFGAGAIAPGEIVSVFGAGVGPQSIVQAAPGDDGRFGPLLDGVRVFFNGIEAPVLFALVNQVAVVAPYELDGATSASVSVQYAGVASNSITVPVAATVPGIFTSNGSGQGQAAALNEDGSLNSAANPVDRGSVIVLFCTGEGQTNPAGVDGQLANTVYPKPKLPVEVTIGGQTAQVVYAGAAPTLVAGLMQINAQVPAGIAAGSAIPVIVKVGNASSPEGVTISIR